MEVIRNSRKSLTGTVTSRSGDKTVKVTYFYKKPHPLYRKEIKRKTVVHVHDEENDCGTGDKVEIMETRPLSKLKRWRVTKVIERAPKIGDGLEETTEPEKVEPVEPVATLDLEEAADSEIISDDTPTNSETSQ